MRIGDVYKVHGRKCHVRERYLLLLASQGETHMEGSPYNPGRVAGRAS